MSVVSRLQWCQSVPGFPYILVKYRFRCLIYFVFGGRLVALAWNALDRVVFANEGLAEFSSTVS